MVLWFDPISDRLNPLRHNAFIINNQSTAVYVSGLMCHYAFHIELSDISSPLFTFISPSPCIWSIRDIIKRMPGLFYPPSGPGTDRKGHRPPCFDVQQVMHISQRAPEQQSGTYREKIIWRLLHFIRPADTVLKRPALLNRDRGRSRSKK